MPTDKRAMSAPVTVDETVWITLSDGCRLAARLWRPAGASEPLPAILEYLPYRRRDRHRGDDAILHPALAAAGYASIRVDMRGSGDSDGIMTDEYTPQEWADACEVIAWLAQQPWCSGAVGMMGLSWSGFNSLQVAALAPKALKAIVTVGASDDRYADDMHYMGGCLLNDNLQYGSTLFTWLATPPDPAIVGERWRDMWLKRLESVSPPALRWMRHGERDAYWKSGSVREDYSRIKAPVLAVGGWADGYSNAVMRLLANLKGPRKGLIGPWGHAFPHVATPGPGMDFLKLVVRWWDHWLKGFDNGIMQEPMLTCWMQESEDPRASFHERKGCWTAVECWPNDAAEERALYLSPAGLSEENPALAGSPLRAVASPPTTGIASGEWCPYGWGPDMPLDQRIDDAHSATFDTAPIDRPLRLLGAAVCRLRVSADGPEAQIGVRLCDVSPDGVSRRITYGLINLAHRKGHDQALPVDPGEIYEVEVRLNDVGYVIPKDHRLRIAVSSAYWPVAVGVPRVTTLTILGGELRLPALTGETLAPPDLGRPTRPDYPEAKQIVPPARGRTSIVHDVAREETRVEVVRNLGSVRLGDVDLELSALGSETYTMPWLDPSRARSEARRLAGFERGDWRVRIETWSSLTFAGPDYRLDAKLEAFEGEKKIFERSWSERIGRTASRARSMEPA